MSSSRALVALVFVAALGSSYFAYGALGGTPGIRIPYNGVLENQGALVSGDVTFTFRIYDAPTGGNLCHTHGPVVTAVTSGKFAVVLGPLPEVCVKGRDVYIDVTVDDGGGAVTMPSRQQVHPAVAAVSSGSGDFHVAGALQVVGGLNVTGTTQLSNASVSGSLSVAGNPWASGSVRVIEAGPGATTATATCAGNEILVGSACWDEIYWSPSSCVPTAAVSYKGAGSVFNNAHSVTCTLPCGGGATYAKAVCLPF